MNTLNSEKTNNFSVLIYGRGKKKLGRNVVVTVVNIRTSLLLHYM